MDCLSAFCHWYNSVATNGDLVRPQDTALFAIASVSAVVWTGGLISWQIKQWNLYIPVSLDLVQTAFMGAIFGLFVHPLTFRYLATGFLVLFTVQSIASLWLNRNHNYVKNKFATTFTLTDERWDAVAKVNRTYATITLCSMILYVMIIVWPYPTVIAWFATIALFVGYQLIIGFMNSTPDKTSAIIPAIGMMGQLNTIIEQLKALVAKP